ncbi:MAG: ABC transporter ATP-binding protein [Clostridiales Family XIII bacterium]|jgi:peptide/nickel transport system ATP-binding protein|nr:ABC transporter ATP-binding protein [Clostridiales Family XIII bacterium]
MKELLWVQNLSVGIGKAGCEALAATDVSFKLGEGDIMGIVGESGCGKTLTALSVLGLLPDAAHVTSGSIFFGGQDITALSGRSLADIRGNEISMIFQEPMTSLNPLMKIGRQIAEPLILHGAKDKKLIRDKVEDMVDKVGLTVSSRLLDSYPHQLSGGMRQRVMIAIAMINRPKLLIADEPTTALDVIIQAQILDLLKKINRDYGTSILFISHDLGAVNQLCNCVNVMYAGRIVERAKTRTIFIHPVHEYTKGLIGAIPLKSHKGKELANIPGKVPGIGENKAGCPFAPRCGAAAAECFKAWPEEVALSDHHFVHCSMVNPESEMEYARI